MKIGDKVLVKMPKGFCYSDPSDFIVRDGEKLYRRIYADWVEGKVIGETTQGLKVYTEARRKAHPYPWAKIQELV